jgi:hypothetical protein
MKTLALTWAEESRSEELEHSDGGPNADASSLLDGASTTESVAIDSARKALALISPEEARATETWPLERGPNTDVLLCPDGKRIDED